MQMIRETQGRVSGADRERRRRSRRRWRWDAWARVLAFANAAPYATISIWEAHRTRELAAAMDWQNRIARAAQLVTMKYGIPGLKYAMDLNGYYGGPPRLPLTVLKPEQQREIEIGFDGIKG